MPTIETCIDVHVPVETACDRWREFELFSQFMEGVKQGNQINAYRLPGKPGITRKGVVTFQPISDVMSTVVLQIVHKPEGVLQLEEDGVEASAGRIQEELKRFKAFVESRCQVKGNWLTSLPYHAFF
jgi:uncharacterized membrane protein